MKKLSFYFLAAMLAVAACDDAEEIKENPDPDNPNTEQTASLTLSVSSLSFEAAGGEQSFTIASNVEWTVTKDESDWFTVTPVSGKGNADVKVEVSRLESTGGRSGVITVTASGTEAKTLAVVQVSPEAPDDPFSAVINAQARAQDIAVETPAGVNVKVSISEETDWLTVADNADGKVTFRLAENRTAEYRTAEVQILTEDDREVAAVQLTQSWRNVEPGELLIEEVFFAGNLIPDTDNSDSGEGDQYIRLTNNADHTVYADRVLFAFGEEMSQTASTGAVWVYPELTDSLGVNTIYAIPGSGTDVPVEPGQSLILALAAQNFTNYAIKDEDEEGQEIVVGTITSGFDLSKADFEFYDENDFYPDTDNPDVPNLDTWFKSSWSITGLHNRGYESYAIAVAPAGVTAESFMTDYLWAGVRTFDWNGYHSDQEITDAYLIPNTWVLDGINCGVEEDLGKLAFNAKVDAGYTGCGTIDDDPARYGKSALRNRDAAGKLVDTNNSTNDFTRDATPTLQK